MKFQQDKQRQALQKKLQQRKLQQQQQQQLQQMKQMMGIAEESSNNHVEGTILCH